MESFTQLLQLFKLEVSEINYEHLLLSLSHKSTLNEQRKNEYAYLLDYYKETGHVVWNILLKEKLFENVSQDVHIISNMHGASKLFFLEKFLIHTELRQYLIVKEQILNAKIEQDITYQFIGFLFHEGHFTSLANFFSTFFDPTQVPMFNDYYSIVLRYAQQHKRTVQFDLLEVIGPDHEKTYTLTLICGEEKVTTTGKSKKEAKKNCSQMFCERYLDHNLMLHYAGYQTSRKNTKRYIIPIEVKNLLQQLANKLYLNYEEMVTCFTHVSLTNEFQVSNNSVLHMIGSDVERLYLLRKIYIDYAEQDYRVTNLIQIVGHIQSLPDMCEAFIKQYKFTKILMASKSLDNSNKSILRAAEATLNAIMYSLFRKNYSLEQLKPFDSLYDPIIRTVDLRFISPSSTLQELVQLYKLTMTSAYQEQPNSYQCTITLILGSSAKHFHGVSDVKKEAYALAATKALQYYYDRVEPFFTCTSENALHMPIVQSLLENILQLNNMRFSQLVLQQGFFGLEDAQNGEINRFANKMKHTLETLYLSNKFLYQALVDRLIHMDAVFFKYVPGTTILIRAVIIEIAEFVARYDDGKSFSFEKIREQVINRSDTIIEQTLQQNGLLIKNVQKPSPKLQQIALKNDINALYYIESPDLGVLHELVMTNKITPSMQSIFYHHAKQDPSLIEQFLVQQYMQDILSLHDQPFTMKLLDNSIHFDLHLRALCQTANITKFYAATGFVYSSGIQLIDNALDTIIAEGGDVELIVGNLQHYDGVQTIQTMDQQTAQELNRLIAKGATIKTFHDQFYHGKVYYLVSEQVKILILGSTNFSRQAFQRNREVDSLYFFHKDLENDFTTLFEKLSTQAETISFLDIEKFSGQISTLQLPNSTHETINMQDMIERIEHIPNEKLRKRLTLWLEYKPSHIFDNIEVGNQEYIAIVYTERNMIVLESFYHGNAYFVFYKLAFEILLQQIQHKTKTEIFELSGMEKRGYHVREMLTLELNIKSYFLES